MEKKFVSQENLKTILTGMKTKVQTMINESIGSLQTKEQVDTSISTALLEITPEIVTILPTENINNKKVYVILDSNASTDSQNVYNEWMYINNKWEKIGSTGVATSTDVQDMTAEEITTFVDSLWQVTDNK